MKTFTLTQKRYALLFGMLFYSVFLLSQTSNVEIAVNWPSWSSENRVEIYNPSGTLLTTIDNGYTGCCDDSYLTTYNLGCVADGNNYYAILYDSYGDGWQGADNLTITTGDIIAINMNGNAATSGGQTVFFNVGNSCGSCPVTVSSYPYSEDFETGLGDWIQDAADHMDWTRTNVATPSGPTGPNAASSGSYFMFTEASSNANRTANFESPCFNLSGVSSPVFSFDYHMYGSQMGTLNVDISTDNGVNYTNLWTQSGQVQTSTGQAYNTINLALDSYIGQTVKFRFQGLISNSWRSDIAIDNIGLTAAISSNEIAVSGNGTDITNNDNTPDVADDTDFGDINVTASTDVHTFTIDNTGTLPLTLTAASPYITVSGAHAADFTLSANPVTPINAGGSTTFDITFNPSATGLRTATITIANDDGDENPFVFDIQGTGIVPTPDINITGLGLTIANGDNTPSITDGTDFGDVDVLSGSVVGTYVIENNGTADLNLSGVPALVDITGANAEEFIVITDPANIIASGASTTFQIRFNPGAIGNRTASVSIASDDASKSPYTFSIFGRSVDACNGTVINSFPYSEGFESGLGNWTQDNGDNFDWTRNSGTTLSNGTGPNSAANGSWYLFTEASNNNYNNTANLESPCIDLSGITAPVFTFNYHMYGANIGTLYIDISTDQGNTYPTTLWSISGPQHANGGTPWTNASIDLSTYIGQTIKIRVRGLTGNGWASDIAIDDLTFANNDPCANLVSTFPYTEGFESDFGDWTQDNGDSTDWTRNTGGTLSSGTGPNSASEGSYYIYTEATNNSNNVANLDSPCFDLSAITNPVFSFSYHMFGGDMGTLNLQVSTDSGVTYPTTLWSQVGQYHSASTDTWSRALVDLSSYSGQTVRLRFNGNIGGNFRSDMAVDDLELAPAAPEMDVLGNSNEIADGDTTPATIDGTNFGSIDVGSSDANDFTIENNGFDTLNLTGGSPYVSITGANAADFSVTVTPSNSISSTGSTVFQIRFSPSAAGIRTAVISIANDDTDENPYNFNIQGEGVPPLTEGPGGVTNELALWLKGTDGLSYTDGQSVSTWSDQGRGDDATVNTAGQEPTYRDNVNKNVNFNPVVEFDNTFSSFTLDSDYSYDNTSTEFLEGSSGFYTQDIFLVIIPDETTLSSSFGFMDVFCSDAQPGTNATDATGIGFGDYTGRISNETICFALDSYTQSEAGDGYAVHDGPGATYDNVGIINTRNNTAITQQELYYNAINIETGQNDIAEFLNVENERFWIGRSEGWEATTNARIAEIITYSDRKDDANLTQERNRIMSYLAIKYGITLGTNGTSQDYVDSDGTVIWDVDTGVPANDAFNYDIAGIGRDDDSDLHQKQSRSVNNALDGAFRGQGVLTMGISSIYDTNNLNPSTDLADKQFLIWGNNGVDLDNSQPDFVVNMSDDISPGLTTEVTFEAISRTWKVVERGGDIPEVEIEILTSAVRTAVPPDGRYLMFISDAPVFTPTADYRVMSETTNELGEATLTTNYDFDGTKYITFGWAPERIFERSIFFDPADTNYVDMEDALDLNASQFTVSAWIKRDSNSLNKSILSKRDASYTGGYDLKINGSGYAQMSWGPSGSESVTSNVVIPLDEWHHIAVIYSGGTATMYIDGVYSNQATSLTNPTDTTHSFYIGAAAKNTPQAFFHGNIDEVRVWDRALNQAQLRFIMNQEIEANSGLTLVKGKFFEDNSITPTKDDISTLPWNDLAGYYPMSTYTYTNTKDESGKGNQGALRNLRTVDRQTAPLPYVSTSNGQWDTQSTWQNGSVQTIPGTTSIANSAVSVDWNIVRTQHNVTIDDDSDLPSGNQGNRTVLGLLVDSSELTLSGNTTSRVGTGLTVSHYLELTGKIDLEGESQLIQSDNSDLLVNSSGRLERDQQGTGDLHTYNYWSSPVGETDSGTNAFRYTVQDVMYDGVNPINFLSSGYDGAATNPVSIADYWIWKFASQASGEYSAWQHVRRTGTILAGEGFTMKGPGTGAVADDQNYVFLGKPNNGNIELTIGANNDYLVGNPYASAIDANQFILDNGSVIGGTGSTTGTLYFWEHWGGGSHVLAEYLGGYGLYNLSGGTPSASFGTNDPDVGTGGTPRKRPGRYIPVSQGFFITSEGSGGTIQFNNGQRLFFKEDAALDGSSTFMRVGSDKESKSSKNRSAAAGDDRMKFRIGFNSVNTINRQLLLTIDENATTGKDWGYDGKMNESQMDDMYWLIDNEEYIIQGSDLIELDTVYPIGIKTDADGDNTISINELENVQEDIDVFIYDSETEYYHNLRNGDYTVFLLAGEHNNRFALTFSEDTLSTNEAESSGIDVYYANNIESIVIRNPLGIEIKSIEMFNILGQSIKTIEDISESGYSEYEVKNLNTGTYIIKLYTVSGSVSKKVIVR